MRPVLSPRQDQSVLVRDILHEVNEHPETPIDIEITVIRLRSNGTTISIASSSAAAQDFVDDEQPIAVPVASTADLRFADMRLEIQNLLAAAEIPMKLRAIAKALNRSYPYTSRAMKLLVNDEGSIAKVDDHYYWPTNRLVPAKWQHK